MLQEKAQLVIDLRKRRIHDLGRHEVREHLLQPHVVEPLHRHQIAEPHVRRLVRNQVGSPEVLPLRGGLVEKHRRARCSRWRRRAPCPKTERPAAARNRASRRDICDSCSSRASRWPAGADRKSCRDWRRPSRRRSRDDTCRTAARSARRVRRKICPPQIRTDTWAAPVSRRNGSSFCSPLSARPISGPLATATHPDGISSVSESEPLMSGWSKQGNACDARAGTNSEYRYSSLRFNASSPAVKEMSIVFSPRRNASAGMTRCPCSDRTGCGWPFAAMDETCDAAGRSPESRAIGQRDAGGSSASL